MNCFSFLANYMFSNVANAFTLVWLRWIVLSDFSCNLSYDLFIRSFNSKLGILIHRNFNLIRNIEKNLV